MRRGASALFLWNAGSEARIKFWGNLPNHLTQGPAHCSLWAKFSLLPVLRPLLGGKIPEQIVGDSGREGRDEGGCRVVLTGVHGELQRDSAGVFASLDGLQRGAIPLSSP